MYQELFFYVVATTIVFSSFLVILCKNPLHSVLSLVWTFLNASVLFLLNGAEFIALAFVIVYIGAVSVLFLFIVMMLEVNLKELRRKKRTYLFIGGSVGFVFALELLGVLFYWKPSQKAYDLILHPQWSLSLPASATNTERLGHLLYTHYFFPFQLSALILLIAMIGAIVLTFYPSERNRKPSRKAQIKRAESVILSSEADFHKGIKGFS